MTVWLSFLKRVRIALAINRLMMRVSVLLLTLGVMSSAMIIGFKYYEAVSWEEATWQVWQTNTTVGYGNRPAGTSDGRWLFMTLGTICIGLLGITFGSVYELFNERKQRRIMGMAQSKQTGGYVLINYPGADIVKSFMKEVRHVAPGIDICVVDDELPQLPADIQAEDDIFFIRGKTLSSETYQRASLLAAKVVIVFPRGYQDDADGQTSAIVSQVCKFVKGSNVRVMYFLVSSSNQELFDHLPATAINSRLDILAAVQECSDPHTAGIVNSLLSNQTDANPKTVDLSPGLVGWSWQQLIIGLVKQPQPCNVLALIKQDGSVVLCPSHEYRLQPQDRLSVVANNGFDWNQMEQLLLKH